MSPRTFVARSVLDRPAGAVFDWHARSGALPRLIPGWERVEVLDASDGIRDGSRVTVRMHAGPLKLRWVALHRGLEPGRRFQDVQERGPFAHWVHTHRFEPDDANRSRLIDEIEYRLRGGALGHLLAGWWTRRSLERLFTFRHARTAADLARQARHDDGRRLSIAVTGASGMVGSALVPFLTTAGHRVLRLVRREPRDDSEVRWDPAAGRIDAARLEGVDAVVNLAGESIAGGRWTEERKARIADSRVDGTRLVASTLAGLGRSPEVLVNASAIGFYGDRGDAPVDESSTPGHGFLADTSVAWEEATREAERAGIRVVRVRIGIVLSPQGGALVPLLRQFRLGGGGRIGSGRQVMSWIGIDDLVGVLHAAIRDPSLRGPVNATAPGAVSNAEFARVLARVVRRPALLPAPAFAIRLALGEMGQALLLDGARVVPARLREAGFEFLHPELEPALRWVLGRFDGQMRRPEMRHGVVS